MLLCVCLGWHQPPAEPPVPLASTPAVPMPCPVLRARLEKTLDVARDALARGTDVRIVFSGGLATTLQPAEAEIMRQWWLRHAGEPANKLTLWLEDASTTTRTNALYTRHLLRLLGAMPPVKEEPLRLAVITSDFHVTRAAIIFSTVFEQYIMAGHAVFEFHAAPSPADTFSVQMPREETWQLDANSFAREDEMNAQKTAPMEPAHLVAVRAAHVLQAMYANGDSPDKIPTNVPGLDELLRMP